MKKIIVITLLVLSFAVAGSAQSEGFIGYTEAYGPTKAETPTTNERKSFTEGFTIGYTYYFQRAKSTKPGKVGIGTDVNVQFNDGVHRATATWVAGLVVRGRTDKKVQPFLRVMGGIGRLGFQECFCNSAGLVSTSRFGPAYVAGVGLDIQTKNKRLKWRIGADYVLTTIGDRNQQFVRGTTGLVFR